MYRNSSLFSLISQNALNLPPPRPLPKSKDSSWTPFESNEEVPFVFVADNAFPLSNICMKPYPENGVTDRKRVFNYRLSRFRRVTENAFGILTSVFRIFSTKINMHPDRGTSVILASLVLHNMLRIKSSVSYTRKGFADEIQGDRWMGNGELKIWIQTCNHFRQEDMETIIQRQLQNRVIFLLIIFMDLGKCLGNGITSWQKSKR